MTISGNLKTLGGDDIVNTNWAKDQPNGDGNCAYALSAGSALNSEKTTDTDYKWYDIDCSTTETATNGVCQFQS